MNEARHNGPRSMGRRLRLITGHTMQAGLRQRWGALVTVVVALLLLAARWLREFNFGSAEIPFLGDFGLGVIGVGGAVLAVLLTAHLFHEELETGSAACTLARPVRRWEYVAGTWAGVAALLALITVVLGGLLGLLMYVRCRQLGVPVVAVPVFFSACALLWMKFALVAAMTLCVATYAASALFTTCAGLLLVVIGHLHPFASGGLEWLRVWPNLGLFDAAGLLAEGRAPTATSVARLWVYWMVSFGWLGSVSAYVFRTREF